MKGSSFYKKNGKSPVKQKDFLDVQQQQNTIRVRYSKNEERKKWLPERKEEIFFSLSLDQSDNCPHNITNNKNNTLPFAKEDANTFHAFSHQIHAQRDRSFSISLSAKRERERERFCFPAFGVEERQSQFARNERETKSSWNAQKN